MSTKAPSCTKHDGDCMDLEECPECISWMRDEEAYWSAYFGGPAVIKATIANEKFYMDELGIDITDTSAETMEQLRRLKHGR